ncbi:MAG: XRE family transcriptional regulator [Pseudomonadota bacterium]
MPSIEETVGAALHSARRANGLSAKDLAEVSGVSAPMISRIENAQSSATLPTLVRLAEALDIPLVNIFGDVAQTHSDYTFTQAGEGLRSSRIQGQHTHRFWQLANHRRSNLKFDAITVHLKRQDAPPPTYVGRGVIFIRIIEGEAIYGYGGERIPMAPGDSIALDAELRHGVVEVKTPELVFLNVQAEVL